MRRTAFKTIEVLSNALHASLRKVASGLPNAITRNDVVQRGYRTLIATGQQTLPNETMTVSGQDFDMAINPAASALGRNFYLHGHKPNEKEFEDLIKEIVFDGMTYVDIGANWGYFSLLVAEYCNPNRIICFEPLPSNRDLLEENARLMNVAITIEEYAISDSNGTATLWDVVKDAESATLATDSSVLDSWGINRVEVEVETRTLSEYLAEHYINTVDMVKIDVEGAEPLVLDGMAGVWERVASIAIELHTSRLTEFGSSADAVFKQLMSQGYILIHLDNNGTRRVLDQADYENIDYSKEFEMTPETVHIIFAVRPGTEVHSRLKESQFIPEMG